MSRAWDVDLYGPYFEPPESDPPDPAPEPAESHDTEDTD